VLRANIYTTQGTGTIASKTINNNFMETPR
jgi:hypothetical protein